MNSIAASEWVVIAAGLTAIVWINWYFFFAGRSHAVLATPLTNDTRPSANANTGQAAPATVVITIDGGYSPAQVRAKAGQPLRLVFDRKDTSGCSEEVVFPDFGIRRFLPTGQQTSIDLTPSQPGRYEFMCGMSMLRGAILVDA